MTWPLEDEDIEPKRGRYFAVPFAHLRSMLDRLKLVDARGTRLRLRFAHPPRAHRAEELVATLVPHQALTLYSLPSSIDQGIAQRVVGWTMHLARHLNRPQRHPRHVLVTYRVHVFPEARQARLSELWTVFEPRQDASGDLLAQVVREEEWTLRALAWPPL